MNEESDGQTSNVILREVPENFDVKGYISMRAKREREHRQELEKKYGDDIPISAFNQLFILACIESLLNMKEQHPEAFDALLAKLRNPQGKISDELSRQIASHGSFLVTGSDGVQKIWALGRAIFREAEKREGGFSGYIEAMLAQRHKP